MIIYPQEWRTAIDIARPAKRWRESGVITADQYVAIRERFRSPVYSPNLFIAIGLFVFTCLALSGVYGLLFLMAGTSREIAIAMMMVVLGGGTYAALEVLIPAKKLYRSGIDEALLYCSLMMMIGGCVWIVSHINGGLSGVVSHIITLLFLLWGVMRFADRLVTAGAVYCIFAIVWEVLTGAGSAGRAMLPFAVMALGGLLYVLSVRTAGTTSLKAWDDARTVVGLLGLAALYCGGNYFAVRETQNGFAFTEPDAADMPLAWLFWFLTIAIPVLYVVAGLLRRDHLLLRAGLLAGAFSVVTVRYYVHLVPPETALTLGGLLMIAMAGLALRALRNPRGGFTGESLLKEPLQELDAEALLLAQTLHQARPAQPEKEKGMEGGGGEFGGGGSSGSW